MKTRGQILFFAIALFALLLVTILQPFSWRDTGVSIGLFALLVAASGDITLRLAARLSGRWLAYFYFLITKTTGHFDILAAFNGLGQTFALAAFLALGLAPALWAMALGVALSQGVGRLLARSVGFADQDVPGFKIQQDVAKCAVSLVVASLVYDGVGESYGIADWTWRNFLALVAFIGTYFLVFHILESVHLKVRGASVSGHFQSHFGTILISQLVPLPLAAVLSRAFLRLDWLAFLVFGGMVIGIWNLVILIREMRRDVEHRLQEVQTLSKIGQAINTSLELDVLLNTLYHQIRPLMEADNFYVALYDPTSDELSFPLVFEDGQRRRYGKRRLSNGLTEHVIQQRKPLLIRENTPQIIAGLGLEMIGQPALSWLGVPMMIDDRVLGVLAVQSFSRPYAYDEKDVTLLSTLAAQAAIALENAQLYGQMRRRTAELALLNTVSTAVSSTLDLDQVLQIVVTSVMPMMACQKSALFLVNEMGDNLELVESQGLSDALKQHLSSTTEALRERVQVQNMVIVPEFAASDRPEAEITLLLAEGCLAGADVALATRLGLVGVLTIYYDQVHHFDLVERDLLATFSNQIATAIANARLFGRTDQALGRRIEELSAIEQIGRELVSTLEPQRVLDLVLDQAMRATGATQGCIAMLNDGEESLNIVAQRGYVTEKALEFFSHSQEIAGVVGRVLGTGEPALIRDIQEDPAYIVLDPKIRAQLTVPITREGITLGAINLESDQIDGFDEQDANFVNQLAVQAAVALKNAELFQERSQRVEELALLYQASLSLASTLEHRDVFDTISRLARHITKSDAVTLYLYDRDRDQFERVSAQGHEAERTEPTGIRARGITRCIVDTGRPVLISDTLKRADINPLVIERGIRSVVGVPVMSRGEVLGVLFVNSRKPNAYTENDVQVISALANQAGATIANVSLFDQVREARDRLEAIINSTQEGILVLDNAHYVVIANPQMENFSELRQDQLIGCQIGELIDSYPGALVNLLGLQEHELEEWVSWQEAHPTDSYGRTFQTPLPGDVTADGTGGPRRFTELFSTPVLDEEDRVIGRLMVFRDVTEEKELEQTREDLIGMMVHDLRSPLTAVLSGLEIIRDLALGENSDAMALQAVEVAKRSCDNMLLLVNSLLDISRLESGRMPLEIAPAPFAPLVHNAVVHLSPLAADRDIVVETDLPPDLPMVDIDNEKIGRVLINLLDNAIKFTPTGERVTLRACHRDDELGNVLLCSVQDRGPGIPKEYHEKIFDRFAQVRDQVPAPGRRGTGLGLAFCKLAIEAHNGRIWVESEPGKGSVFFFTLPVSDILSWLNR